MHAPVLEWVRSATAPFTYNDGSRIGQRLPSSAVGVLPELLGEYSSAIRIDITRFDKVR